jgi:DNA-binding MarR family transcriptional regulator
MARDRTSKNPGQRPAVACQDDLHDDPPVVDSLDHLVAGADPQLLADRLRDRDLAALANPTAHGHTVAVGIRTIDHNYGPTATVLLLERRSLPTGHAIACHMECICYPGQVQASSSLQTPTPTAALESLAVGLVAVTSLALARAGVELTFAQWRVLMVVSQHDEGATVGEVARRIGSAISPASRLITRMRRRGLVVAEKDPHDHRATRVRLSEQGRAVRDRVLAQRRELLHAAAQGLEPLPPSILRQLSELGATLETIR